MGNKFKKTMSGLARTAVLTLVLMPLSMALPEFNAFSAISNYFKNKIQEPMRERPGSLFEIVIERQNQNLAPTYESETTPNKLAEEKLIPPLKPVDKKLIGMSKERVMDYFGLNGNAERNMEVLSNLSPSNFHHVYSTLGNGGISKAIGMPCHHYSTGRLRVENLRRLESRINDEVENIGLLGGHVSAEDVFTFIGIEGGGMNSLNCYGDGGVAHLRAKFHRDVNLLNEEQNIRKAVRHIDELYQAFGIYGDIRIIAAAYNAGEKTIKEIIGDLQKEGKQIKYENIAKHGEMPKITRGYVDRLGKFRSKMDRERLFVYDAGTNSVKYIGPEEGIPFTLPKLPPKKTL